MKRILKKIDQLSGIFVRFLLIICVAIIVVLAYQFYAYKRNLELEKLQAIGNSSLLADNIARISKKTNSYHVEKVFDFKNATDICIVNSAFPLTKALQNIGIRTALDVGYLDSNIWAVLLFNKESGKYQITKYWKWQEPVILNAGCYPFQASKLELNGNNYLLKVN